MKKRYDEICDQIRKEKSLKNVTEIYTSYIVSRPYVDKEEFFRDMKGIDETKGLWLLHKKERDNHELSKMYVRQFMRYAEEVSKPEKNGDSYGEERRLQEVWKRIVLHLHIINQEELMDCVEKLVDGSYMYQNSGRAERYAKNMSKAYMVLSENEFEFEERYSDIMLAIMESNRYIATEKKFALKQMIEESSAFYKQIERDLKNSKFSSWSREWKESDKKYLLGLIQQGNIYSEFFPLGDNPYYYAASCFFERIVGERYRNKHIEQEINEAMLKTAYPRCVDAVRRCLYGREVTENSCRKIQNDFEGFQNPEQDAKWHRLRNWYATNMKLVQLRETLSMDGMTEEGFFLFCDEIEEKQSLICDDSQEEWYYTDAIDNFVSIIKMICDKEWALDVFLEKVDYLNFCKQRYFTFMVNYGSRVRKNNLNSEMILKYLGRYSVSKQIEIYFNSPIRFGIKLDVFLEEIRKDTEEEKDIWDSLEQYRVHGIFMRDKKTGKILLYPTSIVSGALQPTNQWVDSLGGWLSKKGDYTFTIGTQDNQMVASNVVPYPPYDLERTIQEDKHEFENELKSIFERAKRRKKVFAFPSKKVCFDVSKGFFTPNERKKIAKKLFDTVFEMIEETKDSNKRSALQEICKIYMEGFLKKKPHLYCNEYRFSREGKRPLGIKWFKTDEYECERGEQILKNEDLDKKNKLTLFFGTCLKSLISLEDAMEQIDMKEQDYTAVALSGIFRENLLRVTKCTGSKYYKLSDSSVFKSEYKIHLSEEVEGVEYCRIVNVDKSSKIFEGSPVFIEDLDAEDEIIRVFDQMIKAEDCEKPSELSPCKRWSEEGLRDISLKQLEMAILWSKDIQSLFREIKSINPFFYKDTVIKPSTFDADLKNKIKKRMDNIVENKVKGQVRCVEKATELYCYTCVGACMEVSDYVDEIARCLEFSIEDRLDLEELIEIKLGAKR